MINVKLHSFLKNYSLDNSGIIQLVYEEGLTIRKIMERLDLNPGTIGLVLINGVHVRIDSDYKLARGDTVEFFPIFGGG